jgi:ribosomal 50S subunit-recycling heat shock protein
MIDNGSILVNDKVVKASYSVKDGAILKVLYRGTGTKWELVK